MELKILKGRSWKGREWNRKGWKAMAAMERNGKELEINESSKK